MTRPLSTLTLLSTLALPLVHAVAAPPLDSYLQHYCLECHDEQTKKGSLNLATLPVKLGDEANFAAWEKVHDRVAAGEMPPKKKRRPPPDETAAFVDQLDGQLIAADEARRAGAGRATLRRLTRSEYENSLRDLLGLPDLHVKDLLPADGTRHGMDKIGEALDLSHVHLARYLEAADRALDAAIATRATPPPIIKRRIYPASSFKFEQAIGAGNGVLLKNQKVDPLFPPPGRLDDKWGEGVRKAREAGVGKSASSVGLFIPGISGWQTSFTFAPMHTGCYRLRVSTWSFWWNAGTVEPSPVMHAAMLHVGPRTLGYFDAPSLTPTQHEITPWLEMGDEVIFDCASLFWTGLQVRQRPGGGAGHIGPAVAVDWLEVEGPLYPQWPPMSHRVLFGDLPLKPFDAAAGVYPPKRKPAQQLHNHCWPKPWDLPQSEAKLPLVTVVSDHPLDDAARLLGEFLPKAFRRTVGREELSRYVSIVASRIEQKDCFEDAMRQAYRAALTSRSFLFRRESPGALDGDALATRLSLWLWNSSPDAQLLQAANSGELREPEVLNRQIDRMLGDPRSSRFVADFLDQWLNLRNIDFTDPDKALYPEFHLYLKESMLGESRAFFRELIDRDLPVTNVVASDFVTINQRLAEHYGIPGVMGVAYRHVPLPPASRRGGFLTQASVLKVTANGTTTSPVVRGAFVTERILGRPIPPPPPGVPAIDPDTRGATTVREQLAKHRADPACAACHVRMDPPGFALENFDVIGGWRDRYRILGKGDAAVKPPFDLPVRYKLGPAVDATGQTAEGASFDNVAGFQQIVAAHPDQIARTFVTQMLNYATGAQASYADRRGIERIVAAAAARKYGVRSLIHAIAQSPEFQSK